MRNTTWNSFTARAQQSAQDRQRNIRRYVENVAKATPAHGTPTGTPKTFAKTSARAAKKIKHEQQAKLRRERMAARTSQRMAAAAYSDERLDAATRDDLRAWSAQAVNEWRRGAARVTKSFGDTMYAADNIRFTDKDARILKQARDNTRREPNYYNPLTINALADAQERRRRRNEARLVERAQARAVYAERSGSGLKAIDTHRARLFAGRQTDATDDVEAALSEPATPIMGDAPLEELRRQAKRERDNLKKLKNAGRTPLKDTDEHAQGVMNRYESYLKATGNGKLWNRFRTMSARERWLLLNATDFGDIVSGNIDWTTYEGADGGRPNWVPENAYVWATPMRLDDAQQVAVSERLRGAMDAAQSMRAKERADTPQARRHAAGVKQQQIKQRVAAYNRGKNRKRRKRR